MKLGDFMIEKLIDILKNNTINMPRLLLSNYKLLNISEKDLILLIYLLNEKELLFNPKKYSNDLKMPLEEILESVNNLTSKDIIKLDMLKINNMREEVINLEPLYNKLAFKVLNEEIKEEKANLYDVFEKEFGRTLSPIEYELISGWQDGEFSDELIILALKEAVFNGVFNLKYIDKILYEWKKKGIKNKEDIEKDKERFKNKKLDVELVDYDWLNEDKNN
jgi:DNA replication protein